MLSTKTKKKSSRYKDDSVNEEDQVNQNRPNVANHSSEASPAGEDSPNREMLCTQQDEVSWNWDSPKPCLTVNNKDKIPSTPIMTTPKTSQLKKPDKMRSPLMYLPKHGTFITEYVESAQLLINSMLSTDSPQELETIPSDVQAEVQLVVQPEVQSAVQPKAKLEDLNKTIIVDDDEDVRSESRNKLTLTPVRKVLPKKKSFDELFNDSMDDTLFQCSQEVENQFSKLSSVASKSGDLISLPLSNPSMNRGKHSSPTSTSDENLVTKKRRNFSSSDQLEKSVSTLSIPDDSFDDCLATCDVTESKSTNKEIKTYSKTYFKRACPERAIASTAPSPCGKKFIKHSSAQDGQLFKSGSNEKNLTNGYNCNKMNNNKSKFFMTKSMTLQRSTASSTQVIRTREEIERNRREALKIKEEKERQKRLLGCSKELLVKR